MKPMSEPRRYRQDSITIGDCVCYLLVSAAIMFLVAHVMLAIGSGVLP
jgi:hypothetical protein